MPIPGSPVTRAKRSAPDTASAHACSSRASAGAAALGVLGGGQGGRQRAGRSPATAAAGGATRPRRTSSTSARVAADGGIPSSERKRSPMAPRGRERRRAIAVEREQADQLAMRRLGQRLDVQAPARPRDRAGQVAGVLRPGGQRAEHAGQLGGVLVARAQRPVAVEAVEQLAVPGVRGGLELSVGEAAGGTPTRRRGPSPRAARPARR